jgi:hypothetical protein
MDGQKAPIGVKLPHTPGSYSEYADIRDSIHAQMMNFNGINVDRDDEISETPEVIEFSISNYPNPFNPSTTIFFSVNSPSMLKGNYRRSEIDATAHVSINIYNIKGQKVRELVNDSFVSGHHSVVWDGTDNSGRAVGSGVYLYRIVADEFTETKKMILLK